jgi:hypothetical protein
MCIMGIFPFKFYMIIDTLTHIRSISYSTEYRESVVSFVETLIEYYAITIKKKYGLGSEAFKEELITEIKTKGGEKKETQY